MCSEIFAPCSSAAVAPWFLTISHDVLHYLPITFENLQYSYDKIPFFFHKTVPIGFVSYSKDSFLINTLFSTLVFVVACLFVVF